MHKAIVVRRHLTFSQAEPYLQRGYFLTRSVWKKKKEIHSFGTKNYRSITTNTEGERYHSAGWEPSEDDRLSDDWKVLYYTS